MDSFTNLHLHTLYSIQDSVIKTEDLVNKLLELGQTACAVTDHSTTGAHFEFKQACIDNGIKPIYGNEFYMNKNLEEKERTKEHFICLAMNDEGVRSLNYLQNRAVENFYYKPTLDYDSFIDHSEGLFATSACSQGIISKMILNDNIDLAWDWADSFMNNFDGNFALELQFHPNYPEQYKINEGLLRISELSGIPLTVSTDAHFIDNNYLKVRKAVVAIGYKKKYDEVFDSLVSNCVGSTDLVLKFAEESNFDLLVAKKAIKYTSKIANRCNADLCTTDRKVPVFTKGDELLTLMDEVL